MKEFEGKILGTINSPADLKSLSMDELSILAHEIRQYIIHVVSRNAGHLGASLGTVELTLALHYTFNTPYDKLIWDVGHQAYGHKIITGRREAFLSNRQYGGLSGFPAMEESKYDAFGVGHSSTSISAALGMAVAARLKNDTQRNHIAVIGDGAMTAGQAFEALNNAGTSKANLLVVLNDNNISIDKSVGSLKEYLLEITTSRTYNKIKDASWELLGHLGKKGPTPRTIVQKLQRLLKGTLLKESNFTEALHFRYFGPLDGHDTPRLIKTMQDLKNIPGPKLLHVITTKGKGYKQAEKDKIRFHAPGRFDVKTGENLTPAVELPATFQHVFGKTLLELARKNPDIAAVTPAMPTGSALNDMMKEFPQRTFDVGIAEQHAVTFSAGLATRGMTPFCVIYSTFLQRAYDQIIHDVALQKLPVILAIDRGGLVGEDGATHHGVFDLAYLNCIPNMIIAAPMDAPDFRNLLFTAQNNPPGPFAIRYPKGTADNPQWEQPMTKIPIGTGRRIKNGNDLAFITIGNMGVQVQNATKELEKLDINHAHYDMRFLKPLDENLLHEVFQNHEKVITIEDGTIIGGLGSAVLDFMSRFNYKAQVIKMGIPDQFVQHGSNKELYQELGLDTKGIVNIAKTLTSRKKTSRLRASY